MSTTDTQIGIMEEIDPNYLESIVYKAVDIIDGFGYYGPDDYNTEQLCVVVYGKI